eukprot:TRINITY_DN5971_c0_g1_i2.p1 TRINITY_DN5971_c0_g1~~TRINITY_DN5971_c0_g1_i2.p1  ORF type:complete len:613 (+),score=127.56 TRINITY_DN5971_c0_g1_i2:81-1919(+)
MVLESGTAGAPWSQQRWLLPTTSCHAAASRGVSRTRARGRRLLPLALLLLLSLALLLVAGGLGGDGASGFVLLQAAHKDADTDSHDKSGRQRRWIGAVVGTAVTGSLARAGVKGRGSSSRLSATADPDSLPAGAKPASGWRGAKPKELAMCILLGLLLRFVIPVPSGVSTQGWSMVAIFASAICGIVTAPLPAPAVALAALAVATLSGTLTFAQGVAAFTDEVVWIVLLAFFFAEGLSKTGLGTRMAYSIVRMVGGTTLGLAYGLNAAEGLLAAGMPSSASRAAGVFFPIVDSVAKASGSDPAAGTERRTGRFLVQSAFQATGNSASLWLTGAAQNFLVLRLASQLGYGVASPFKTWLLATSVPAGAAMALTPLVVYYALPPEVKRTPEAPEAARKLLKEMGPMRRDELIMAGVMIGMVCMWAGSGALGIPPVVTALLGLSVLLATGTLTWDDCVAQRGAWSTFVWFAILVSMGAMLNQLGVVRWFADSVSTQLAASGLSSFPAFWLLLGLYMLVHYFFASQVAHVSALFQPFVAMMVATGTPPFVAVMSLAVASNVFGSLTPYASAQAPAFFAAGYVTQAEWYKMGLLFAAFNMAVWGVVGGLWWKFLGYL